MTTIRFLFLVFPFSTIGQDFTDVQDVHVLSELSLGKLLELRGSFGTAGREEDGVDGNVSRTIQDADIPQAMALQGKKNPKDRGGYYHTTYHYDVYKNKKDKNSIQSIFQISVTTLAFLAFGAYLLCLLIHAIKGKSGYQDMPEAVTQMVATYLANRIKKTKVLRAKRGKKKRPQRTTTRRPQYYLRPGNVKKRPSGGVKRRPKRDVSTYVTEDMYEALVKLSEAYTKYHTVDYTHYNSSLNKYY